MRYSEFEYCCFYSVLRFRIIVCFFLNSEPELSELKHLKHHPRVHGSIFLPGVVLAANESGSNAIGCLGALGTK